MPAHLQTRKLQDLFEVDNAKALYPDQLARTFVGTDDFWRLLSAKNHVVLGSRGSGKTALVKMLAHDYLARYDHPDARTAINDASYIGVYVPLSLDWVGALKTKPWADEEEGERLFQWRLNVAACGAFLVTIESCLTEYRSDPGSRAQAEYRIASELGRLWGGDLEVTDLLGLRRYLRHFVADRGRATRLARVRGTETIYSGASAFDDEVFAPIRWATEVASEVLDFPVSTVWLICIDETELLRPFQQRILNTALRSASGRLFFKITTLPYGHHTLETNTDRELEVGHDFEYVRIDRDPVKDRDSTLTDVFVRDVYEKRQRMSPERYPSASLQELFGSSPLLDPVRGSQRSTDDVAAEIDRHLLPTVAARANALLTRNPRAYADQFGRRLRGTMALRDSVRSRPGHRNLDVYSGATTFVRCADGNPRRIIRLFKAMLEGLPAEASRGENPLIPRAVQTEVMIAFSGEALQRARAEEGIGFDVFELVNAVGRFAHASTHAERISTDAVTTVRVDSRTSDRTWAAVMKACDLGLLFANVRWNNPDQWPDRSGYFHLAYVLAPHFRVLPRRGRSRSLSLVLQDAQLGLLPQPTLFSFDDE